MEIKFTTMKKIIKYILEVDKKSLYLVQIIFTIIMFLVNYLTPLKFENGTEFIISFISIVPVDLLMIFLMIRIVNELETPFLRQPAILIQYLAYFMIILFVLAPFIYLWGMRTVLSNLKW